VVKRTFPDGIIPEGIDPQEAPNLEDTMVKWRDQGIRESRRRVLLKQLTLRLGPLPGEVRCEMAQISSDKRLERKILSAKSLQEVGFG
jgi:hypothetical protein